MAENLSTKDKAILSVLSLVRGLMPEDASHYPEISDCGSTEALRKRMSRMAQSGFLAVSALPNGRQIYRLSHKGVNFVGAPSAWAASPSAAVTADMLSVSRFAYRKDEFVFLTNSELTTLLTELGNGAEPPKTLNRFLLRRMKVKAEAGELLAETRLHVWLSEPRPADALAKRVRTVTEKLMQAPLFSDLMATALFGFTLVVPSLEAKKQLEKRTFPPETSIEVCESLQDLIHF